jgi:hypothetical protein
MAAPTAHNRVVCGDPVTRNLAHRSGVRGTAGFSVWRDGPTARL